MSYEPGWWHDHYVRRDRKLAQKYDHARMVAKGRRRELIDSIMVGLGVGLLVAACFALVVTLFLQLGVGIGLMTMGFGTLAAGIVLKLTGQ